MPISVGISIITVQWHVRNTSVFLAIYFNKKSLHSMRGVLSVLSPQSENERLLLDVIIYIF